MSKISIFLVSAITILGLGACSQRGAADTLTIWTTFNDQSPQNDEDKWLATTMEDFKGEMKKNVINEFQNYDQLGGKLNLAVTSGGNVPDISYVHSQQLSYYIKNGTLEDLTTYVKNAKWYTDLDSLALQSCTGPDGKIYCVPYVTQSRLIYYWKKAWPQGFPRDTTAFLIAAEDLKQKGLFAITFKGSERDSAEGFYFSLISSFGGKYVDSNGNAAWASDETVKAVQFVRVLVQEKYVPEVVLTAGWDNERPFMDGSAAAFGAASWSYQYLNPVTSPTGVKFDDGELSIQKALDAGELGVAPYLAAPDRNPVVLISVPGWAIPRGAKNSDLAKQFIDYMMNTQRVANYALVSGGLPALSSGYSDPRFQTEYWIFVKENQDKYGAEIGLLDDYDKAVTLLADAITKCLLDSSLDILTVLQAAQDAYNSGR
jgi:ABC-type glycerol-3-phosphate transport system substrate-binding protein